jgi:hypothetical protein
MSTCPEPSRSALSGLTVASCCAARAVGMGRSRGVTESLDCAADLKLGGRAVPEAGPW